MLKVKTTLKDGRILILLGLSEVNLQRLKAGEPIYADMDQLKLAPDDQLGALAVFYGVDEAAMTRHLQSLMGPETAVLIVPRGSDTPT